MNTHIHRHTYTEIYTHRYTDTHIHGHTYTRTHIYTDTHIHRHTHTHHTCLYSYQYPEEKVQTKHSTYFSDLLVTLMYLPSTSM